MSAPAGADPGTAQFTKAPASCSAPPSNADATTANRDKFIGLWAPRVQNKAWFTNFVGLADVPADIQAEGFHTMDRTTQAWLVACLVDSLVATSGQAASPAQVANYQVSLDVIIFGKDQLQTARNLLNKPNPPASTLPNPPNMTKAAVDAMVSRLSHQPGQSAATMTKSRVTLPTVAKASTRAANATSTPKTTPKTLSPNSLASTLQSILNTPLLQFILTALNDLEQLLANIQAVLFTVPVLNVLSTLFYKVCAESATQPLACSVSVPLGVPIPADVTGDHFPDVLAELVPVVANGTDFGVSFSVTKLITAANPLKAHVFFVYDVPLANKRIEYGYNGLANGLSNITNTTVTLKNAFRLVTAGDVNVQATVSSINPAPTEALTFAVKDLVGGSPGHPATEANPVAGVVDFNPFPKTLTMGAHLTHNSSDEDIFTVGSSTPSTVTAVMNQDMTTTPLHSHRQFTALVNKLPTSLSVDMTHNGSVQNIRYNASASITEVKVGQISMDDVVNHPTSYTTVNGDVMGVPSSVNVTLSGAQDITYSASSVIPQVTFDTMTYKDGTLQQLIAAQAQGIPATMHVTNFTGDTSTITYDASSVITSIAFQMYDLNSDQTNLLATATSIPTHMQFIQVKSSGVYDLSANAGIGLITATLTRGGDPSLVTVLTDPGVDHATVYKRGTQLGLDFQLSGFQSAHFENSPKTIVSLGLSPGGQAFDAIADLDDPNVLATAHITQLPSVISVTVDPNASTYTYSASAPINAGLAIADVGAAITRRDAAFNPTDTLSAGVFNLPQTITLKLDTANSAMSWNASAATGKVVVGAHLTAATLGQPRGIDAALTITSIPALWTATYGSGNVDFEAPSPGIGSIDAWVTNHTTHTSLPGDFLAAYFDEPTGDLDAALHISNLQQARFTKLTDGSGGGFVADLAMGNNSNFAFTATVNLGSPTVTTALTATGSLNPLPSAIHLSSDGGRIRYQGNTNPTLTLSVAAGNPDAITNAPAPNPVQGVSIRDGQNLAGDKAVKALLKIPGLPDNLDINPVAGTYTVGNFNICPAAGCNPAPDGDGSNLHVDAVLTTLASSPISINMTQDLKQGPVSFVFGPFVSSTDADGTHRMNVNYTSTRDLGAFDAEVTFGVAPTGDDAMLHISDIPGGGSPSISVKTAFGNTNTVDVDMTHGITEIDASYRHVGDGTFGGSVQMTGTVPVGNPVIPAHINLKLGSQTTGDSTNGATAPQMTFTASSSGLNINAHADATLVGASAAADLMITNMGSTVTGALDGLKLNITSTPKTGSFTLVASGHVNKDISLNFSGHGFVNTGNLNIDLTVSKFTLGFVNAGSLGLELGVTTGLTGDFDTFTFGQTSSLSLTIDDDLNFEFDLPIIGHESVHLVGIHDFLPLGNVVPQWNIQSNTTGTLFSIPVFSIPFVVTCSVGISTRPHSGTLSGSDTFTLGTPLHEDGQTDAWLLTPDVTIGGFSLGGTILDVVGFFASPYGHDINFEAGCD